MNADPGLRAVRWSARVGSGPGRARRVPLRAAGLLGISAVVLLAWLIVGAALVFRTAVQQELQALERAHQAQAATLARERARGLALQAGRGDAALPVRVAGGAAADDGEWQQHLDQALHYVDGAAVTLGCIAWLGLTVIGALTLLYFSRLASDLRVVAARAHAIVQGDRRCRTTLRRNDELGDLSDSVDGLAVTLGTRERDLQLERAHALHRDRLATVGAMAAGVVHEIGNPIAAIDGYARSLLEAPTGAGADPPSGAAQRIVEETRRLLAITRDMSQLAAEPDARRQLVSLNELVRRAVATLRYELRLDGVAVETDLDPLLPALEGSADRLVVLLVNLLCNAVDAMEPQPTPTRWIMVLTRRTASGVTLVVRDNGCGMTEPTRLRAFDPLFTTKPSPAAASGLGLTLCRAIVQEHGGTIELESAPGRGTTATVRLACAAESAAA